jgi:hypothetical protein
MDDASRGQVEAHGVYNMYNGSQKLTMPALAPEVGDVL